MRVLATQIDSIRLQIAGFCRGLSQNKKEYSVQADLSKRSLADYNLVRSSDLAAISSDQLKHPIVEFPATRLLSVTKKRLYEMVSLLAKVRYVNSLSLSSKSVIEKKNENKATETHRSWEIKKKIHSENMEIFICIIY